MVVIREAKCTGNLAYPTASSCGVEYSVAFFAATGARDRRTRRVTAHLIGFEGAGFGQKRVIHSIHRLIA